ncbi:response regulator [Anaerotalea alkaliphila]|uniref:Stage 0 sporulation protein A homolog n=1 Tax=Anaerotalea alkaliphila TaxID=2662126 RepID=A0A7X5HWJ9_9FIRM|nr:response regulator [Anaerotalea alkaliphila]NDL67980.1 response regulator [Anaerotalea alkaliphila]
MEKRVLVVNDSRYEGLFLEEMLQRLDYTVKTVDENEALSYLESFSPDLLIVEDFMEGYRGDNFIHLVKAGLPTVKCVLSTTTTSAIRLEKISGGDIDAVLRIPVSMAALRDTLHALGELH